MLQTTITPDRYAIVKAYMSEGLGDFAEAVCASDLLLHEDQLYGLRMLELCNCLHPKLVKQDDMADIYADLCASAHDKITGYGWDRFVAKSKPTFAQELHVQHRKRDFEDRTVYFWHTMKFI